MQALGIERISNTASDEMIPLFTLSSVTDISQ